MRADPCAFIFFSCLLPARAKHPPRISHAQTTDCLPHLTPPAPPPAPRGWLTPAKWMHTQRTGVVDQPAHHDQHRPHHTTSTTKTTKHLKPPGKTPTRQRQQHQAQPPEPRHTALYVLDTVPSRRRTMYLPSRKYNPTVRRTLPSRPVPPTICFIIFPSRFVPF